MTTYYVAGMPYSATLYHHGILGQKWGVRRYQYEDGTLTPAGKERYAKQEAKRQEHINRGKVHLDKNRTVAGALGRGALRSVAIGVGKTAAGLALAAVGATAMSAMAIPLISAGAIAVDGLALGLTVGNIVKTYGEAYDIASAQGAGYVRKKDRAD